MLGWALNLDFAGSESGVVIASKAGLLLLGVGVLRLLALV